jgi:hypothetical protein
VENWHTFGEFYIAGVTVANLRGYEEESQTPKNGYFRD